MISPMAFGIGLLVTWRMTHLFNAEDGPGQVIVRFRSLLGASFLGEMLDCFYCLSVWVALPLAYALGTNWPDRLWLWPALSGGACLLNRIGAPKPMPDIIYEEEEI